MTAPRMASPQIPRPGRDTTPSPDPGRAAVPPWTGPLDVFQYWAQACVRCGRRFDPTEHPEAVGSAGGDQHLVYACHRCPPSFPQQQRGAEL